MPLPDLLTLIAEDASFTEDTQQLVWNYCTMSTALLHATIFFPEFIEVEGSILLKMGDTEKAAIFIKAKAQGDWPLAKLEDSFNWIEPDRLFADSAGSEAMEIKLAHIIADSWRARLGQLYPARTFTVYVIDPDITGYSWGVGFYEVRLEPAPEPPSAP